MVAEASDVISQDPWLLVPAGGVLVLTVLALGLIGDAVQGLRRHRGAAAAAGVARAARRAGPRAPPGSPGRQAGAPPTPAGESALLSVAGLTIAFRTGTATSPWSGTSASSSPRARPWASSGSPGCGKTVTARALLGLLPEGGPRHRRARPCSTAGTWPSCPSASSAASAAARSR